MWRVIPHPLPPQKKQQRKKKRDEFVLISISSKILHGNAEKTVYRTWKIVQTTE